MDELGDIKKKQELLSGWIEDLKRRQEQLPYVEKSLELTDYQLDLVSNFPPAVPPTVKSEIIQAYSNTKGFWQSFVETPPGARPYTLTMAVSGLALEASGSNVAFEALSAMTVGHPEDVTNWAREKTIGYQNLQHRQRRDEAVEELIQRLLPVRAAEFKESCTTFAAAVTGGAQSAWGIAARNLLEHVKGELFAAAQKALSKQKVKWAEFAGALARQGAGSNEHAGLLVQENMYNVLHTGLTDIAKNRLQLAEQDLRDRRTELHDHLFAVLSLVDEIVLKKHS